MLDEYTNVTGKAPMPPLWSFGFWMSRITYLSEQEVRTVAAKLRENKIPADLIHLDTGWFETDWRSDYQFSKTRFPDPAKMIADLKKDGFHVSLWQLPYFVPKNLLFPEIVSQGLAVRDGKGNLPSEDAVLDFSNPEDRAPGTRRSWRRSCKLGVGAIKVDFGEAAPFNGLYASGRTASTSTTSIRCATTRWSRTSPARSTARTSSGRAARGPGASAIRSTGAATR